MKKEQRRAPLAAAMEAYAAGGALAFHTPGHKQGLGADPLLKKLITEEGLKQEVSLMAELDDLNHPEGCIREAEELAAELWDADSAFFMVNGTTGAIHTMIMAALSPGDEVLVPRNAHRSIMGGIVLSGACPVYMQPTVDERLGIAMGLTTECVEETIRRHPTAKAVVVVYPTYYGVACDLSSIVRTAHAHGMTVLVDEAHGAHLHFSEALPPDAVSCGADLVAQSTHKTLGSMTQTSMLFLKGGRIEPERVRRTMSLLTSTSPNYLLMASLDIARYQMAAEGRERVGRAVWLSSIVRSEVNRMDGLWCFGKEYMGAPGAEALDTAKLTVQVAGLGMTGAEAEQILRWKYKLQCELADTKNVLFILSMADTEETADRLTEALRDFSRTEKKGDAAPAVPLQATTLPAVVYTPREAMFRESESIVFEAAEGRISAEEIAFYPPGIPVILPGERITRELMDYIKETAALGLRVTGPQDTSLKTLRVLR